MTFPRFAIIEDNALVRLGLQNILEDIIPVAEVVPIQSFEDYQKCDTEGFAHCFISSRIFFEHTTFFKQNHIRCIVLVNGDMTINGIITLNVCQSEKGLVRNILALNRMGHGSEMVSINHKPQLTPREIEIAILLAKGMISKEVADHLNISVNTAITHRQNIVEKLQARSLADIIVYLVRNGLMDLSEI